MQACQDYSKDGISVNSPHWTAAKELKAKLLEQTKESRSISNSLPNNINPNSTPSASDSREEWIAWSSAINRNRQE